MSLFYDACRSLYAALFDDGAASLAAAPVDEAQIAALRRLVAELAEKAEALEAAVAAVQNGGGSDPDLSRALLKATFMHNANAQLLMLALDGREQIKAAADAIDGLTGDLRKVASSTASLTAHLTTVTAALDAVGKVMKLATA